MKEYSKYIIAHLVSHVIDYSDLWTSVDILPQTTRILLLLHDNNN